MAQRVTTATTILCTPIATATPPFVFLTTAFDPTVFRVIFIASIALAGGRKLEGWAGVARLIPGQERGALGVGEVSFHRGIARLEPVWLGAGEARLHGAIEKRSFDQRTMRYADVREIMEEARPKILEKARKMARTV